MTEIRNKIQEANEKAVQFLITGDLRWVGMRKALDTIPGMRSNHIYHAGPPISWDKRSDI